MGKLLLIITSYACALSSSFAAATVLIDLKPFTGAYYEAYVTQVHKPTNDLSHEPLLAKLGINTDLLGEWSLGETLLSPYAQTWAKKRTEHSGPNCFHTSIAAVNKAWKNARYMGRSEFKCHLEKSFEEISEPREWGDLIAYFEADGTPIHGFTYLGVDRARPQEAIAFTKNGYAAGYFLFMTVNAVHQVYESFGIGQVRYYRFKEPALDPSDVAAAPCAVAFSHRWKEIKLDIADPREARGQR